jgi:hypothetical protein
MTRRLSVPRLRGFELKEMEPLPRLTLYPESPFPIDLPYQLPCIGNVTTEDRMKLKAFDGRVDHDTYLLKKCKKDKSGRGSFYIKLEVTQSQWWPVGSVNTMRPTPIHASRLYPLLHRRNNAQQQNHDYLTTHWNNNARVDVYRTLQVVSSHSACRRTVRFLMSRAQSEIYTTSKIARVQYTNAFPATNQCSFWLCKQLL